MPKYESVPLDAEEPSVGEQWSESQNVPRGTLVDDSPSPAESDELKRIDLMLAEIGNPYQGAEDAARKYSDLLTEQRNLRQRALDMTGQIDVAIRAKQVADEYANKVLVPEFNRISDRKKFIERRAKRPA